MFSVAFSGVPTDLLSALVLLIIVAITIVRFVTHAPVPRRFPWRGVFQPFGLGLALCSALLAWGMSSVHNFAMWSGRAFWVLVAGMLAYIASAVVVSLWPPGTPAHDSSTRLATGWLGS